MSSDMPQRSLRLEPVHFAGGISVVIPKKSGGKRVLGIPTMTDRIAQTVVKLRAGLKSIHLTHE